MTAVLLVAALSSPLWIPDYMMERITTTQIEVEGEDAEVLEGRRSCASTPGARSPTW